MVSIGELTQDVTVEVFMITVQESFEGGLEVSDSLPWPYSPRTRRNRSCHSFLLHSTACVHIGGKLHVNFNQSKVGCFRILLQNPALETSQYGEFETYLSPKLKLGRIVQKILHIRC